MMSDPEESVRLQGFGEMTLRTAIATVMLLAPRERADAACQSACKFGSDAILVQLRLFCTD